MKRFLCFLLTALLCSLPLSVCADDSTEAFLEQTYVQCDDRWKDIPVGDLTIAQSACGIATVCNAVYYLTGQQPDLVDVAFWANGAGLFNAPGVPGCYRSVFAHAGEEYGSLYGFTAASYCSGGIRTEEIAGHLLAGGTVAVHVPGHFMALVDYDPTAERYLVIDPMPGDNGKYDTRRAGLTHTTGDWLTADDLSAGYLKVDGYSLFTRVLSDEEGAAVRPLALNALLGNL